MSETRIIDMLYLELSQFCKAKTKQELFLEKEIDRLKIRLQNREFNQSERDQKLWDAARETHTELVSVDEFGEQHETKSTYQTLADYQKAQEK